MTVCEHGLAALIAAIALGHPAVAAADSDGYYCAGSGYLAYETRFTQQPAQHLLHVITFSRVRGIARLEPIALDDFQVHGMSCGATVINLQAWTTSYLVDIADPAHPVITQRPQAFRPGGAASGNLGHWAQEGVVDLESDAARGEFQLVMARVSRPVPGGTEDYTFTHLIRRDAPPLGRVVESVTLFEGVFLHTVD
jgi:hypothetical protein